MDVRVNAEAPQNPTHVAIRREDYIPPDWLVPEIALTFELDPKSTRVQAKLTVERNPETTTGRSGSTATESSR